MPTKSGKPTKREREAAFRAKLVEAVKNASKVAGKAVGKLTEKDTLQMLAGASVGAVALYPQIFDRTAGEQLEVEHIEEPDPRSLEQCEAEYRACLAECNRLTGGRRECIELCGQRRQDCINGATKKLIAIRERWRFQFRVRTLAVNIVPDVTIPATSWNIRDALALTVWKEADGFRKAGDPDSEAAEKDAQRVAEELIRRDLLILGIGMGASGPLMAELVKGAGEMLKGVGEIVPG